MFGKDPHIRSSMFLWVPKVAVSSGCRKRLQGGLRHGWARHGISEALLTTSGQLSRESKVSGSDVSKLCNFEFEGTEGSKHVACLFVELSNISVEVTALQETYFTCADDCRVLKDNFEVFSAFSSGCITGVSLLVGPSLNLIASLVFAGDGGGWLWPMLPLKASSFGWSQFMCSIPLARGAPFLSTVGTIPRWSETENSSMRFQCNPWSQER